MRRISRRTVLRGTAATALGLPLLEIMQNEAHAGGSVAPKRYVTTFCGCSLGHNTDRFTPDTIGAGYDLKASLESLGPGAPADGRYDIQGDVMVVSGMRIPVLPFTETATEPATAAGGATFHSSMMGPLFSGTTSHTTSFYVGMDGTEVGSTLRPQGPTSQNIVADAVGGEVVFPTLTYKLCGPYVGAHTGLCMSYRRVGDEIVQEVPVASPQQAYNSLVGLADFDGSDPEEVARRDLLFRRQLSALDLAADDAKRLANRSGIGKEDQRRLDRHFTEVRELEKRIQALREFEPGVSCTPVDDPGQDPPFDGTWYDEDARGRTFNELIRMALACDLTRTASILYSGSQNTENIGPATGFDGAMHNLTHNGGYGAPGDYNEQLVTQMGAVVGWHVKRFAELVRMLKDTPDGPGSSLLDNTVLVFLPEGGSVPNAHSLDNYALLIAGHSGGLAAGTHVAMPDVHPAKAVISAMVAVGAPAELGELSGSLPELFV